MTETKGKNISGLDMKETIGWYTQEQSHLIERMFSRRQQGGVGRDSPQSKLPYARLYPHYVSLAGNEFTTLLSLFPEAAQRRSILKEIIGHDSLWFDKESTTDNIKTTNRSDCAIAPTAIIPSYISYQKWKETGEPQADIVLYKIDGGVPKSVRKIIHAEGFVHEYAHSIIVTSLYIESQHLGMLSGGVCQGQAFLSFFAEAAEQHSPISHYSSTYWKDGRLRREEDGAVSKTAINEEFAETIAAYLLGFVFCEDESRRMTPLKDRPDVEKLTVQFLNARLVK